LKPELELIAGLGLAPCQERRPGSNADCRCSQPDCAPARSRTLCHDTSSNTLRQRYEPGNGGAEYQRRPALRCNDSKIGWPIVRNRDAVETVIALGAELPFLGARHHW